jgi:hypothetical protein
MPLSQRIVQVCLLVVAAIALAGGTLQMILGEPTTSARLDNVHRAEPHGVWLGYLVPELLLPVVIAAAHHASRRGASAPARGGATPA